MNKIKIALIEAQRLFREGILALLREADDLDIAFAVENGANFLERLSTSPLAPDVVLIGMDISVSQTIEFTKCIQQKYPEIKPVILTLQDQKQFIIKLMEAGAASCLIMDCKPEELILAIKTVHHTGMYYNELTLKAINSAIKSKNKPMHTSVNIPIDLTERELEILKMICMEYTNVEIAQRLCISSRTVDGHRNKLLAKTGAKNTAGLVLFAVNNHILESALSYP